MPHDAVTSGVPNDSSTRSVWINGHRGIDRNAVEKGSNTHIDMETMFSDSCYKDTTIVSSAYLYTGMTYHFIETVPWFCQG